MHKINITLVCFLIFTIISSGLAYKIVISSYAAYDTSGEYVEAPVVGSGKTKVIENKSSIMVVSPKANAVITSPLFIKGEAVGTWYFEASFPVHLLDGNGIEIASTPATAKGDWMTTNMVPFELTLNFTKPATPTGTIILQKDNPSGDPTKDESISIPIKF